MANRKRRKPQTRPTPPAPATKEAPAKAAAARIEASKPRAVVVREPWSRGSIAILVVGAWLINCVINLTIGNGSTAQSLGFSNVATKLALIAFPDPFAILPAVLILELPVRMLRHERRLGLMETLATGAILSVFVFFIGTGAVNINQPSVTTVSGTSGSSASPSVSPSAHPSATASPSPSPSPSTSATVSPSPAVHPSAQTSARANGVPATPEPGTAPPGVTVASASDNTLALIVGDIVGSFAFILLYPWTHRNFIAPQPRPATPRREPAAKKRPGK